MEFAELARGKVPGGFGGWFYDEEGRPHVYLVRPNERAAAVAALVPVLRARRVSLRKPMDLQNIQVHQGQYDFNTLLDWRRKIGNEIPRLPGILRLGVAEHRNRVSVGVQDQAALQRVREALPRLGIPPEAVLIEQVEPEVEVRTLEERIQRVPGGYEIRWENPSIGGLDGCSMGFNAWRYDYDFGYGWEQVFVTASHCSRRKGQLDYDIYYQLSRSDQIGYEIVDPPFDPSNPYCYAGSSCRWSDALAAVYTVDRWDFGRIARTEHPFGSKIIYEPAPTFVISGEIPHPEMGEIMQKVGWRTGWTKGEMIDTCSDKVEGTRITLCQDWFRSNSGTNEGGDSGAPVFSEINGLIYLRGVYWSAGGSFSSMWNVEEDLGELETF